MTRKKVLIEVVREFGADTVYWNDDHERAWRTQTDHSIAIALQEIGIKSQIFRSEVLLPAGDKENYELRHFTPQWDQFLSESTAPRPRSMPRVPLHESDTLRSLKDLGLPPTHQLVPMGGGERKK